MRKNYYQYVILQHPTEEELKAGESTKVIKQDNLPLKVSASWCKQIGIYTYIDVSDNYKVKQAKSSASGNFVSQADWDISFLHVLKAVNNRIIKLILGSSGDNEFMFLLSDHVKPKIILYIYDEKIYDCISDIVSWNYNKTDRDTIQLRLCESDNIDKNIIKLKWHSENKELFDKYFDCTITFIESRQELIPKQEDVQDVSA